MLIKLDGVLVIVAGAVSWKRAVTTSDCVWEKWLWIDEWMPFSFTTFSDRGLLDSSSSFKLGLYSTESREVLSSEILLEP